VTPPSTNVAPTAEPKTDLGVTRTILAAERTLMAWVRTALSMISFGFAIFKFLQGVQESGAVHLRRPQEPRNIGLFLVVLGTGAILAGMVEHVRTLRGLPGQRPRLTAAFYLACAVFILGLVVLRGLF
jgi:putative membrane protein